MESKSFEERCSILLRAKEIFLEDMNQLEIDFHKDLAKLKCNIQTIETNWILAYEYNDMDKRFEYILSHLDMYLQKSGYELVGIDYMKLTGDYSDLFYSYNNLYTKAYNEKSNNLWNKYEFEKITTPTGLPWGIITSSTADYIAYAVLDTFHSMGVEKKIEKNKDYSYTSLANELENQWNQGFETNFMPILNKCHQHFKEYLLNSLFSSLDINVGDYFKWETLRVKNNHSEISQETLSKKEQIALDINNKLAVLRDNLSKCKPLFLGILGKDAAEVKKLRKQISELEYEKENLHNNRPVIGQEFVFKTFDFYKFNYRHGYYNQEFTDYTRNSYFKVKYDEKDKVYVAYDEKHQVFGKLSNEFTKVYGSYREFTGKIASWDWNIDKPSEFTAIHENGYTSVTVHLYEDN